MARECLPLSLSELVLVGIALLVYGFGSLLFTPRGRVFQNWWTIPSWHLPTLPPKGHRTTILRLLWHTSLPNTQMARRPPHL